MQARYYIIFLIALFFSALSQVLLKFSANRKHQNAVNEYLNKNVICAYLVFFGCVFASSIAYKGIPLKHGAVLETLGYVYILIMDRIFFKQRITLNKTIGSLIIIIGVCIFFL